MLKKKSTAPVRATAFYFDRAKDRVKLTLEHLTDEELDPFLFKKIDLELDIIQEFTLSRGYENEMILCDWTPSINILERRLNPNRLHNTRVPLYQRLITYEGPSHLVQTESVVSALVLSDINIACNFISDQLLTHDIKLLHANFYFKIDQNGELVLLWATNIHSEPQFKKTSIGRRLIITIPDEILRQIVEHPAVADEEFKVSPEELQLEPGDIGQNR